MMVNVNDLYVDMASPIIPPIQQNHQPRPGVVVPHNKVGVVARERPRAHFTDDHFWAAHIPNMHRLVVLVVVKDA